MSAVPATHVCRAAAGSQARLPASYASPVTNGDGPVATSIKACCQFSCRNRPPGAGDRDQAVAGDRSTSQDTAAGESSPRIPWSAGRWARQNPTHGENQAQLPDRRSRAGGRRSRAPTAARRPPRRRGTDVSSDGQPWPAQTSGLRHRSRGRRPHGEPLLRPHARLAARRRRPTAAAVKAAPPRGDDPPEPPSGPTPARTARLRPTAAAVKDIACLVRHSRAPTWADARRGRLAAAAANRARTRQTAAWTSSGAVPRHQVAP